MYSIVRNRKLDNGKIEGDYVCSLGYGCKDNMTLNLIYIEEEGIYSSNDFTICKSCLNFLIKEINKSILSDIAKI